MKHLMTLAVAAFGLLTAPVAAATFGPLVSPQTLSATDANPLVIDIRGKGKDGVSLFEQGHIEDAVNAPYGLFRGPKDNPGKLVTAEHLQKVLRDIGATKNRPTVIAYQGANISDFGAAARVYWTLKSAGFKDLSILNGGLNNWTKAGLPLSQTASTLTPSTIEVTFSHQWLATTDDVLKIVNGQDKARLVDARPEEFWKGDKKHPAAAKPGTLATVRIFRSFQLVRQQACHRRCRQSQVAGSQGWLQERRTARQLLQHRSLGGNQLVCPVRTGRTRQCEALSRLHGGLLKCRSRHGQHSGSVPNPYQTGNRQLIR